MIYSSFKLNASEDVIQRNVHWIAVIIPYKFKQTFDSESLSAVDKSGLSSPLPSSPLESSPVVISRNSVQSVPTGSSRGGLAWLESERSSFEEEEFSLVSEIESFNRKVLIERELENQKILTQTSSPIILSSDIINFSVNSSVESPTGTLSLNLAASFNEKVDSIGAEDWIVFWALENKEDYDFVYTTLQKILEKEPNLESSASEKNTKFVNSFENAPKFVGQISSISQSENIDQIGTIDVSYTLNCYSFNYMVAKQYFNEVLDLLGQEASRWWSQFDSFADNDKNSPGGLVDAQEALWRLIVILLGVGVNQGILKTAGEQINQSLSPNEKYTVPAKLVEILTGKSQESNTVLDINYFWFGIQKYNVNENNSYKSFLPNQLSEIVSNRTLPTILTTSSPLIGKAYLGPLMFNNNSNITILQTYLSQPINEMYSGLKVQEDGRVYPTTVFRQNPKCLLSQDPTTFGVNEITYFKELPVWEISPKLIYSKNLTISGGSRNNYMQITPLNWLKGDTRINPVAAQYAKPITDTADILRNGLQPFIMTVPLVWAVENNETLENQNSFFNKLMASIAFNSHLKLSGSVVTEGTQLPICAGDCCEIDGVKYYIESVSHTGGISPNGSKNFRTNLVLTDGVIVNQNTGEIRFPKLSFLRHSVNK